MKVYEAIPSQKSQLGMMWHGMALAHQAITDNRFVTITSDHYIQNNISQLLYISPQ